MTLKEKMAGGEIYFCSDPELVAEQEKCLEKLYDFNATRPSEHEKRAALLKELFASVGEGCYVEPPLHTNWGRNTHFGNHIYANFNLTLVDDTDIYVGDHVMFGPNVTVATAGHPVNPELRRKAAQFNIPVRIGNNVWDRRGRRDFARCADWRKFCDWRRQRSDKECAAERRRSRKSVSYSSGDRRA